jgi:hypothetical protein
MSHIHAESMKLYAEDAAETERPWSRWEVFSITRCKWIPLDSNPQWAKAHKYRRIDPLREFKEAHERGETIQFCILPDTPWIDLGDHPGWEYPPKHYRIKPKTVELWQWIMKFDGTYYITSSLYPSEEEVRRDCGAGEIISKAEWTKIEVSA